MNEAYFDERKPVSGGIAWLLSGNKFGPRIALAPEDGSGSGGGEGEPKEQDPPKDDADDGKSKDNPDDKKASEGDPKDDDGKSDKKTTAREAELLREVMDKKDKLKQSQKELDAIKQQLKNFEGINPDEIKEMLKQRADAEKAAAEAKGDFDRVKAMMAEEHAKELEKVRSEKDQTANSLAEALARINDLTIGDAFLRSSFIKDELILTPTKARTVYGSHFDMEDGKIVAYDKPKGAASRTMLVDSSGDPLDFESAVKKLVESDPDRDAMLRSKLKEGAGSKPAVDKATPKKESAVQGVSRIAAALSAAKVKK